MNKADLIKKIEEVDLMNKEALQEFSKKVSLSNVDQRSKSFLYKAIDIRAENIRAIKDCIVQDGDYGDIVTEVNI